MVLGEGVKNFRVTIGRAKGAKENLPVVRAKIKRFWREQFSFLRRRLHDLAIGMTRIAIRAVGFAHRAAAEVFEMTRGTGKIFDHIRLMKIMLRMTMLAGRINLRH